MSVLEAAAVFAKESNPESKEAQVNTMAKFAYFSKTFRFKPVRNRTVSEMYDNALFALQKEN